MNTLTVIRNAAISAKGIVSNRKCVRSIGTLAANSFAGIRVNLSPEGVMANSQLIRNSVPLAHKIARNGVLDFAVGKQASTTELRSYFSAFKDTENIRTFVRIPAEVMSLRKTGRVASPMRVLATSWVNADIVMTRSSGGQTYSQIVLDVKPSLLAIPVHQKNGRVIMIQQLRAASGITSWHFPAGYIEDDTSLLSGTQLESAVTAQAYKELYQEAAFVASRIQVFPGFACGNDSLTNQRLYSCIAIGQWNQASVQERAGLAEREESIKAVNEFKLPEIFDMLDRGEITDAFTMIGILRLKSDPGLITRLMPEI